MSDFEIDIYAISQIVLDAFRFIINFSSHILFDFGDSLISFVYILIALFFIDVIITALMSGDHPNN